MGSDHTAAGLIWSNAGILIMEDGLIYRRAISGQRPATDFGAPANFSFFERTVLLLLAGVVVSAALPLPLQAETIAAVTTWLTP